MDSNSHLPPLSSQKNEMLIFGLCWTSDSRLGWPMDSNPIHDLSPAKEWNAHFWITFNFWWSAGLVDRLKPHLPPLSTHKMKCSFLHYVQLVMISQPGQWTRTPSAIPLQTKKVICSFLYYIQVLIIGWAGQWTRTPSATSPQRKKWNAHFWITFNFWWLAHFRAGQWTQTPSATPLHPKKWNAHFWIMLNFW